MNDVSPTGVWTLTTYSPEPGVETTLQKIERGCVERATSPSTTTLRQTGVAGYSAGELVAIIHDLCDHWRDGYAWCWMWRGYVDTHSERPRVALNDKWYDPGKILYELEFGLAAKGIRKSVCGNRLCVRPHHQFYYSSK